MRFNYEQEWNSEILNNLCQFYKGNGLSKNDLSDSGYSCILYGQLYTTYLNEVITSTVSKTNAKLDNPFYAKRNDLIIPSSGEDPIDIAVARSLQVDNVLLGGDLNVLRPKSILNSSFLSYQLNGKRKVDIAKIAQGKSIVHLHNCDLKRIKINYPCIEEQNKIANLLFQLDKLIETQIKIIEDYEELKSWITDQIFNREVSTKKLKSLIFEVNQRNKLQLALDVLTVSNKRGFIKQSEQFEERNVASEDTSNYKIVCVDQYAYNPARINVGSIARLNNYEKGIISPMYTCFEINEEKLNPIYFDLFLKSKSFKSQLNKKLEGSVRQCLIFSGMLSMEIPLPSIQTQSVIAKRISMLDSNIKIENTYLVRLKQQKKYLLDNLFI